MNIAVITLGDKNIIDYSKYTFAINQHYCSIYGYTYIQYNKTLDETRPIPWSKIQAIQNNIDNFDWIYWIDADAIFFNHDIRIEDRIDENYNLILAKACGENWVSQNFADKKDFVNINTGSFLIRGKSSWSKFLLDKIYSKVNRLEHQWWENQALADIYLENNSIINSKIKILDQYLLNGTETNFYCYEDFSLEQFILHYAGISCSDREYCLKIRYSEFLNNQFTGQEKLQRAKIQ